MGTITLAQAETIIDAILQRAREQQCRPMAVVVVEPGAVVKAFKKEDDAAMLRFEMAMGKAYAALALGRSSSLVRVRAEQKPLFMDFLFKASDDKIFAEGRLRHQNLNPSIASRPSRRLHGSSVQLRLSDLELHQVPQTTSTRTNRGRLSRQL